MIEDFDDKIDNDFMKQVAAPYFRDIFHDVAMRSVSPAKGGKEDPDTVKSTNGAPGTPYVDNVAFFEFTKLPGIICDRFFSTFKRNKDNFIYENDWINGFMRVYLSNLDDKMRLVYSM